MLVARGLLPWRPGRRSRVCARARVCAWVHAHTCAHSRRKSHFNWIDGERRNNNSYVQGPFCLQSTFLHILAFNPHNSPVGGDITSLFYRREIKGQRVQVTCLRRLLIGDKLGFQAECFSFQNACFSYVPATLPLGTGGSGPWFQRTERTWQEDVAQGLSGSLEYFGWGTFEGEGESGNTGWNQIMDDLIYSNKEFGSYKICRKEES